MAVVVLSLLMVSGLQWRCCGSCFCCCGDDGGGALRTRSGQKNRRNILISTIRILASISIKTLHHSERGLLDSLFDAVSNQPKVFGQNPQVKIPLQLSVSRVVTGCCEGGAAAGVPNQAISRSTDTSSLHLCGSGRIDALGSTWAIDQATV